MHGVEEQVPRGGEMLGVSTAIPALWRRDPMNISWHDPELYYFLTLLAGIAALLASLYEFSRPGRLKRAKPQDVVDQPQVKPLPGAVPARSSQPVRCQSVSGAARSFAANRRKARKGRIKRPSPSGGASGRAEQFSRLCESIKDLPAKERASRMDRHFGVFGGAPPPKARGPGRERR